VNKIPKDRQIIIAIKDGKFVAMFSEADDKFVYAKPQTDMYEGKWSMNYYENGYIEYYEIIAWSEL